MLTTNFHQPNISMFKHFNLVLLINMHFYTVFYVYVSKLFYNSAHRFLNSSSRYSFVILMTPDSSATCCNCSSDIDKPHLSRLYFSGNDYMCSGTPFGKIVSFWNLIRWLFQFVTNKCISLSKTRMQTYSTIL